MRVILSSIFKYFKKVLIVLALTSIVIIGVFEVFRIKLSDLYLYAGTIYLAIGGFSFMGNTQLSASFMNYQARSISSKSMYQNSASDQDLKESGFKFVAFMGISAFALFAIYVILYNLSL